MSNPGRPGTEPGAPGERPAETRGLAALVLAAGASSRMRELKPLLPFAGSTVLERAVRTFLDAGVRNVSVVVGHQGDRLRPVAEALGVRCVLNPGFERGMYSSVVAGISSLAPDVAGVFVLPADMPAVRGRTVELLARVFRRTDSAVVYPLFRGRRGHPPLVSRRVFAAIVEGSGVGGLRQVLERYDEEACAVRVLDEGVALDLDTPADYRSACAELGDRSLPSPGECLELLSELGVDHQVVSHGYAVARIAGCIARDLAAAGVRLDPRLVESAGVLHDLAKGVPDHAAVAARLLEDLGFSRVAVVVGAHTDLPPGGSRRLDEPALVYLADKLVKGDRVVSLRERFQAASRRSSGSAEAGRAIARRRKDAVRVASLVDEVLGAGALERLAGKVAEEAGAGRRARVQP
jgi:CTP:molybdopterin cytidylyltransferase MocA